VTVAQAIEIVMPRLSDSMEEGTVAAWLKQSGDVVQEGDPLVEIETDKATMEYEAEDGGVLEIVAVAGSTVSLGVVIARLLPEGTTPSQVLTEAGVDSPRLRATPVARRLAAALGIDLADVRPTGRRGQIMKADIEATAGNGHADAPTMGGDVSDSKGAVERLQLSRLQQTVAARMSQSHAVVPDFMVEVEIDMDACLALRAQLKDHADPAPSINDMIIKACALCLRDHPRVNGAYREQGLDLYERVNVGMAVAAQDALVVPVVVDADRKSLREIAVTTRALAAKVRDAKITPPELSGGTFTVSNLGMLGVSRFIAVIDPPQAAILAVGAIEERARPRDGKLEIARRMTATLASDHRILYGADAARFLTDVRERLEAPLSLVV
jgi:pyruvate dehydrogenase E2 component (dihydrolipoamide acetyltransferase)